MAPDLHTAPSWHIIFGWNMVSCSLLCGECMWGCGEGVGFAKTWALFLEMSALRGVVPHVVIQASLVSLKDNRCSDVETVCPQLFICHSPMSGCGACCGLWNEAPGMSFDGETPLMKEFSSWAEAEFHLILEPGGIGSHMSDMNPYQYKHVLLIMSTLGSVYFSVDGLT